MRIFGGFESTKIHGSGTDIIETSGHLTRWRGDLDLLLQAGILDLRYSSPWHRIEAVRGVWDWSWMDGPMAYMRSRGMRPVIDLIHHVSFPEWLGEGLNSPAFPGLFAKFARAFAERYDWVQSYTIFNEPLATTILCSLQGVWYPHLQSEEAFAASRKHVACAVWLADVELRRLNPNYQHVYVDTCEHHTAPRSPEKAASMNTRRFLLLDLIKQHCQIDVLGLDYYRHSEMRWTANGRMGFPARPLGFKRVAEQYIARYGLPVMMAETNIRGTVDDRLEWLKHMEQECIGLVASGVDFRGFCWYPSVDSTDWSNLVTRATGEIDPQGIWWLDERLERHASVLSEYYAGMAVGPRRIEPAKRGKKEMQSESPPYTQVLRAAATSGSRAK